MLQKIFNVAINKKEILITLNFLTQHLRRRHLDVLFLINDFKGEISRTCLGYCWSVHTQQSIRDYPTFTISCNFKASPSLRCVCATNAVSRSTDIFNKDLFCLLILVSFLNPNNFSLFLYFLFVLNCIYKTKSN